MDPYGYAEVLDYYEMRAAGDNDDSKPRHPQEYFDYGRLFETEFNILVIDDEVLVGRMLKRVLMKYADKVFIASTPGAAERILRNQTVNLIVCDFDLGRGAPDGTHVLESIRREFVGIETAVIFSGNEMRDIPRSLAVDEVLRKSCDLEKLCEIVRRAAEAHHSSQL